ncbi:NAD kinase-like [Hippocampus zosterae]|uniref:NAD kinase-like n=1 Tax=Hippocampus zosterae TaxID=109293 RepID=UPI00223D1B64|nr:NAD kinase-like [Hippocampus zosterae]
MRLPPRTPGAEGLRSQEVLLEEVTEIEGVEDKAGSDLEGGLLLLGEDAEVHPGEGVKLAELRGYRSRMLKVVQEGYEKEDEAIMDFFHGAMKHYFCSVKEPDSLSTPEMAELCKLYIQEEVDLIMVVGGDSAVKFAALLLQERAKPVLCISKDNESMLGSIQLSNWKCELPTVLTHIRDNRYYSERLMRLHVLSEVVVRRKTHFCIKAAVFINGEHFTDTVTDGIIVATPLGSTGYAMNCGGPIVNYRSTNIVLVAVNPLTLSFRPLVMSHDIEVEICISKDSRSEAEVHFDGKCHDRLRQGESIRIRQGHDFEMVRLGEDSRSQHKIKAIYSWNAGYAFT